MSGAKSYSLSSCCLLCGRSHFSTKPPTTFAVHLSCGFFLQVQTDSFMVSLWTLGPRLTLNLNKQVFFPRVEISFQAAFFFSLCCCPSNFPISPFGISRDLLLPLPSFCWVVIFQVSGFQVSERLYFAAEHFGLPPSQSFKHKFLKAVFSRLWLQVSYIRIDWRII